MLAVHTLRALHHIHTQGAAYDLFVHMLWVLRFEFCAHAYARRVLARIGKYMRLAAYNVSPPVLSSALHTVLNVYISHTPSRMHATGSRVAAGSALFESSICTLTSRISRLRGEWTVVCGVRGVVSWRVGPVFPRREHDARVWGGEMQKSAEVVFLKVMALLIN